MDVTATLWTMSNGKETELKYKGRFYVLKPDNNPNNPVVPPIVKIPPKKPYTRNIKISYLEKWITNGSFEVFTLDQFFKQHPKQKRNDSLNRHIHSLIDKKFISQFNKPSGEIRYKVNRKVINKDGSGRIMP